MTRDSRSTRKGHGRERFFWIGLAVIGLGVFIALILMAGADEPPRRGNHWHARYVVIICGVPRPQFPYTQGGVHTHGDGVVHIHPESRSEMGRNANLRRFFESAGAVFAQDRIELPDGTRYRNGDRCPDGTAGMLRLLVNGKPSDAYERYVPRDGDTIVVEFGPPAR